MCFDSKMVDDPKWLTSIVLHRGEYYFCLARLCMTRNCRTCNLTSVASSSRYSKSKIIKPTKEKKKLMR